MLTCSSRSRNRILTFFSAAADAAIRCECFCSLFCLLFFLSYLLRSCSFFCF